MKKIFENWRSFKEVLDLDNSENEYDKILQSIGKVSPKKKTTGSIKPACNCVDKSESNLSVSQIKKIINQYYEKDSTFQKLDISSVSGNICDNKTKKAIMQFQADTNIEQDGCVGDETTGKMIELGLTNKKNKIISVDKEEPKTVSLATTPSPEIEKIAAMAQASVSQSDMSHVEEAKKEMKLFKNGKLKEWDAEAWPYIAKYWKHIGSDWFVPKTLNGYYLTNKPDRTYHWSAAFIQYCMRGNKEFQQLKWSGSKKGNHSYYWKAAQTNTKKLKNGTLSKGQWFYLTMPEAKKIGYSAQIGDILFIGNKKPKHHGDIVVSTTGGPSTASGYLKIGGNNSHSVMYQHRRNTGLLTQNPVAYNLIANPGSKNNKKKEELSLSSIVSEQDAQKFSFYLGTIDGKKIASYNENKQIYGASMQKPIAALVQTIQYKQDPSQKLNDEELRMLLSYSRTFRGSNQVNRSISSKFSGGRKSYKKRKLGKIDTNAIKQILSIFGISNNTKFVYSDNKQSALDYFNFLSGLARMTSNQAKNEKEKEFANLYGEEMKKVLNYTNYIPDYIRKNLNDMGINKFWGKGGRAGGALNYGIVIDNKYVLVVYTRFSNVRFGKPGYEKTGKGGAHTNKMLSIIKHLVNKIK